MKPGPVRRFTRRLCPIFFRHAWVTNLPQNPPLNTQVDPPASQAKLTKDQKDYVREACKDLRHRLLYLAPIVFTLVALVWIPDNKEVITNITVRNVFLSGISLAAIAAFLTIRHFSMKYHIIARYAFLLRRMEENQPVNGTGGLTSFRMKRSMNRDLRGLARLLARLPLTIGTRYPDVVLSTAKKAAYVRWLQVWVAQPMDENTYGWLYTDLLKSFSTILMRQWQDLPEREPDPRQQLTKLQRTGYVLLSLVLAAGAVALIINGSNLGTNFQSSSQIGATLLAVGAYLSLARAGLIPGSLQQALDTAKKITGK